MRLRLLLFIAILFLFPASVSSQRVIENESTLEFVGDTAIVDLMIDASAAESIPIELSLLNENDTVMALASTQLETKPGKHSYRIELKPGPGKPNPRTAIWQRLRYAVGRTSGIIAVSELIRNVFELTDRSALN